MKHAFLLVFFLSIASCANVSSQVENRKYKMCTDSQECLDDYLYHIHHSLKLPLFDYVDDDDKKAVYGPKDAVVLESIFLEMRRHELSLDDYIVVLHRGNSQYFFSIERRIDYDIFASSGLSLDGYLISHSGISYHGIYDLTEKMIIDFSVQY